MQDLVKTYSVPKFHCKRKLQNIINCISLFHNWDDYIIPSNIKTICLFNPLVLYSINSQFSICHFGFLFYFFRYDFYLLEFSLFCFVLIHFYWFVLVHCFANPSLKNSVVIIKRFWLVFKILLLNSELKSTCTIEPASLHILALKKRKYVYSALTVNQAILTIYVMCD